MFKENCIAFVNGEGTFRAEAEKADFSQVVLGFENIYGGQTFTEFAGKEAAEITSGLSVGKIGVKGNKIKVYVYSNAAYANVSLKLSMALGDVVGTDEKPTPAIPTLEKNCNDTVGVL